MQTPDLIAAFEQVTGTQFVPGTFEWSEGFEAQMDAAVAALDYDRVTIR